MNVKIWFVMIRKRFDDVFRFIFLRSKWYLVCEIYNKIFLVFGNVDVFGESCYFINFF